MRGKLFDIGLYREGLRQTKRLGLEVLVGMILLSLLFPLEEFGNILFLDYVSWPSSPDVVNLFTVFPFLPLVMYLFTPALTYHLFSFLNHRARSDFYHGIPQTRCCLYVSFSAAIFTWVLAAILISVLTSMLAVSLLPRLFHLNIASVWPYMVSMLCGSFLVMALLLAAMSLTGNTFSNLVLFLLLLFLPRFILTVIPSAVTSVSSVILSSGESYALLDPYCNIAAGLPINAVRYMLGSLSSVGEVLVPVTTWGPSLYTGILGVLYYAAGMYFFRLRPSEAAQNSAISRPLQAGLRIAVAMIPGIPCCLLIFYCIVNHSTMYWALIAFLLLAALLAYFMFELLSTRRAGNLLHILPGLLVLLGLNAGIVAAMTGIYQAELHFLPEESEVTSITLTTVYNTDDYLLRKTEEIEITDREAISLVCLGLENAVLQEKDGSAALTSSDGTSWSSGSISSTTQNVIIRTASATKYRRIYLSVEDSNALLAACASSEEMTDLYRNLPDYDSGLADICVSYADDISTEDAIALYEMAQEEIAALDFTDAYQILNYGYWEDPEDPTGEVTVDPLDWLSLTIVDGTEIYSLDVPLMPLLMPETCAMYTELANAQNETALSQIKDYLTRCIKADEILTETYDEDGSWIDDDLWLYTSYMAALPEGITLSIDFLESVEQAQALLELLETASGEGEEYLMIYYYYYRDDEGVQMQYILPFDSSKFTEDFLAAFAA